MQMLSRAKHSHLQSNLLEDKAFLVLNEKLISAEDWLKNPDRRAALRRPR
jgi:hypothetical protein